GRYLIAAPALALAAAPILPRIAHVVRQFSESRLIAEPDRARYAALVSSTRRLLTARWADAAIVTLAIVVATARSHYLYPADVPTWVLPAHGARLGRESLAGWWRLIVSQPLFLT